MINIKPYIGPKYSEGGFRGEKVLVLGESSYDSNFKDPNYDYSLIVLDNVENCVFRNKVSFFTKVAKLLLLSEGIAHPSRVQIEEKWRQIAFHNYIQNIFSGPRQRPTSEMWAQARVYLMELLKELKPDFILILGKELGANLSQLPNEIKIVKIAHPSSVGFKYQKWSKLINEI